MRQASLKRPIVLAINAGFGDGLAVYLNNIDIRIDAAFQMAGAVRGPRSRLSFI
jgi:hypothetical protein